MKIVYWILAASLAFAAGCASAPESSSSYPVVEKWWK